MSKELTMGQVRAWINEIYGSFNVRNLWYEHNIQTIEAKAVLRTYLNRLVAESVIAKTPIDGTYRRIDTHKVPINWETADPDNNLPIQLPFGLHTHCKIFPKSIIIVAGSKSEGKTAYLTECVKLNMEYFNIDFYNSESGKEQLKTRFMALDIPTPAPFATWERYDNFADVIEPDHLSIIDYLDTQSEFVLAGDEINNIFMKLTTGCAIIGLQKPPPSVTYIKGVKKIIDRDLAYGGGLTMKRAQLYISMSQHRLKIADCKTPMNPTLHPKNMMWSYDFDEKGCFTNINRYEEYEGYE